MAKAPVLGGGLSPQEWLRSGAKQARKVQANARAREAEDIANYIDSLERETGLA